MEEFSVVKVYDREYIKAGDISYLSTTIYNYGTDSVVKTTREFYDKKGGTKVLSCIVPLEKFIDEMDGTKYNEKKVEEYFKSLEFFENSYKPEFYDENLELSDKMYIDIDGNQLFYGNPNCEDENYQSIVNFLLSLNPLESLSNRLFADFCAKFTE